MVCLQGMSSCTMSPCPVVGEIPVEAVVSPVVPVAEASFNLSGPAGQWLAGRQDQESMWQGFHCRL